MTGLILIGIAIVFMIGIFSFHKRIDKGCCESTDNDQIKIKKIDTNLSHYPYTTIVHIDGMHCENCVNKVKNAYGEKGCYAEVSLSKKQAVVHSKKKLSDEMLTAIPVRIGYDAHIIR